MPLRLRALLRQALTVHVPDPADSWRSLYDTETPTSPTTLPGPPSRERGQEGPATPLPGGTDRP
jgi:hypothetical protein